MGNDFFIFVGTGFWIVKRTQVHSMCGDIAMTMTKYLKENVKGNIIWCHIFMLGTVNIDADQNEKDKNPIISAEPLTVFNSINMYVCISKVNHELNTKWAEVDIQSGLHFLCVNSTSA